MNFLDLKPLMASLAQAHGYDGALLAGQAWQESRFNPDALSPAGARGLMQFMPSTWAWAQDMGWIPRGADITDPTLNLQAGIRYMQWLLQRYAGAAEPLSLALAAYNAGQKKVDDAIKATGRTDWAGIKASLKPETQGYVPAILDRATFYKTAFVAGAVGLGGAGIAILAFLAFVVLRRVMA